MTVPELPLSRIRTVSEAELSSGRVVAVERNREWQVGITVGPAATLQILLNDPEGRATAVSVANLRMTRVLDLGAATQLVLKVDRDEGEARRWDSVAGCLGVTRHGLVLCAAGGRDTFGDWRSIFVGIESDWTVLDDVQDLVHYGLWFTQWQLSLMDAHEHPHRILGNPVWAARQRR